MKGSISVQCNSAGQCPCQPTVQGLKCDECKVSDQISQQISQQISDQISQQISDSQQISQLIIPIYTKLGINF